MCFKIRTPTPHLPFSPVTHSPSGVHPSPGRNCTPAVSHNICTKKRFVHHLDKVPTPISGFDRFDRPIWIHLMRYRISPHHQQDQASWDRSCHEVLTLWVLSPIPVSSYASGSAPFWCGGCRYQLIMNMERNCGYSCRWGNAIAVLVEMNNGVGKELFHLLQSSFR